MTAYVIAADAAENLDRAGGRAMRLLFDAHETDGRLSALVCQLPAAVPGPPLHVHPNTDELFLVQSGTLLLHTDGTTHRLAPGDAAFVARGTRHTFAGAPGEPIRFITVHTPGGFEQMHREVHAAEAAAGREFGAGDIIPIAQRFDWVPAGPPLLPNGELAVGQGAPR